MKKQNEFEKNIPSNQGFGDYQTISDQSTGSNKWLVVTLAFIVMLIGGAALFSGSGTGLEGETVANQTIETRVPTGTGEDGDASEVSESTNELVVPSETEETAEESVPATTDTGTDATPEPSVEEKADGGSLTVDGEGGEATEPVVVTPSEEVTPSE
ncbi:MAG: hypothetical protein AAGA53_04995 [Pseudomonadota bacterium]